MNPYKFYPLFSRRPDAWFKIIHPPRDQLGYFPTDLVAAQDARSSARARSAGKFVPANIMRDLYKEQCHLVGENGIWRKIASLKIGFQLSNYLRERSIASEDAETTWTGVMEIDALLNQQGNEATEVWPSMFTP